MIDLKFIYTTIDFKRIEIHIYIDERFEVTRIQLNSTTLCASNSICFILVSRIHQLNEHTIVPMVHERRVNVV